MRIVRFAAALVLAAPLAGCVTYPEYVYVDRPGSAGDYYYVEPYDDGYGRSGYGYSSYVDVGYGYSGYDYWPSYYSVVWPVYYRYYDPWWSPGYYYGVTWFPRTYFGFGLGYYDAWPWYHHYSPYRYSFWDGYYDWRHRHHRHDRDWRRGHGRDRHRFGSARNEAERIAALTGAQRGRPGLRENWRSQTRGPYDDGWREGDQRDGRTRGFGVPVASTGLYGAPASREITRIDPGATRREADIRGLRAVDAREAARAKPVRGDYTPLRERDAGYDGRTYPRAKPAYPDERVSRGTPLPAERRRDDAVYGAPTVTRERSSWRGPDRDAVDTRYQRQPDRRYAPSRSEPAPRALPSYSRDAAPPPRYSREHSPAPSYRAPQPSPSYSKPASAPRSSPSYSKPASAPSYSAPAPSSRSASSAPSSGRSERSSSRGRSRERDR